MYSLDPLSQPSGAGGEGQEREDANPTQPTRKPRMMMQSREIEESEEGREGKGTRDVMSMMIPEMCMRVVLGEFFIPTLRGRGRRRERCGEGVLVVLVPSPPAPEGWDKDLTQAEQPTPSYTSSIHHNIPILFMPSCTHHSPEHYSSFLYLFSPVTSRPCAVGIDVPRPPGPGGLG